MSISNVFRLEFRLYHKQAHEWEAVTTSLNLLEWVFSRIHDYWKMTIGKHVLEMDYL